MRRPSFIASLAFLLVLASPLAMAQAANKGPTFPKKKWYTYPQAPKIKPHDPMDLMRINLAYEVPHELDRYTFKTTNMVAGKKVTENGVHAFDFSDIGRPIKVGTIETGREFKLEMVRKIGEFLYYGLPWDKAAKAPAAPGSKGTMTAWVNGNFIAPASYNPPAN